MKELQPFDGVLLVDKPSGPTSHDCVAAIRRHFRIEKVGHGGTLDPLATGLLIILTGRGTKLSESIMGFDKTYAGTLRLGVTTDSQDADGAVVAQADPSEVTRERLEEEIRRMTGDLMQIPPMVSAIKKDGVPLYKMARKGQTIERQPKLIHVYRFDLLDFNPPDARFVLKCTKGTYVRTLCHDIGQALGCGAHLAQLRRTGIGSLNVEKAIGMDRLMNLAGLNDLLPHIIPLNQFKIEELGP